MKTAPAILLFTICVLNLSAQAQIFSSCGVKFGTSYAKQDRAYAPQTGIDGSWVEPIWGFDCGVFAESSILPCVSLLTEIRYVEKGWAVTVQSTVRANNAQGYLDVGTITEKMRSYYVDVPVLVKFALPGDVVTPYIAIGPRLNIYLSSRGQTKYKSVDVGVTGCVGVEASIDLLPRMLIEASYSPAISDVYKNDVLTIRSRLVELLVGVVL